ncbi:MAG: alpha-amylase family protein [Candidatus Methylacidiphilales bacterium]
MKEKALRFRQVHLDFHTSGDITDVGTRFDKRQFQEALRLGNVNSITLFSKCHHGWSYHPTGVGKIHPHLNRNLLAEQIEACREINVRCPIYLSAGVDEYMAMEHPEWVVKSKEGVTHKPLEVGWFKILRFNSPYLDYLCAQIEEVNDLWPDNDGIFLDIIGAHMDYSPGALREMKSLRLNPEKDDDVRQYSGIVLERYFERTTASSRSRNPENRVFHNSGHISIGSRHLLSFNSHLELESLPTGGWGWDHFPLTARYAQTTGYDFLGMTGKFHTSWGEFGGFKRPAALRYECAQMLAMGAKCSIGDQLHPSGEMNRDTYALIGVAYNEVAVNEPWCGNVVPSARIAIVSTVKDQGSLSGQSQKVYADEGASRMLLELQLPFVVLDAQTEWTSYDLIILPDSIELNPDLLERAKQYLANGGRILASGSSLMNADKTAFAIDPGATLKGRGDLNTTYLVATDLSPAVPVRSEIAIRGGAWDAELTTGRILAGRADSYFNRTWEHFCSHQHAPDAGPSPYPAAVLGDRVAWFANDIFTSYRQHGQPLYRDFILAAIRQLLNNALPVETTLPSTGRAALMEQPQESRYIFHLLFAIPSVRGTGIEILEDLIPIHDVRCTVRVPKQISNVRMVPNDVAVSFTQDGDAVSFTIPRLEGHQMVEMSYVS